MHLPKTSAFGRCRNLLLLWISVAFAYSAGKRALGPVAARGMETRMDQGSVASLTCSKALDPFARAKLGVHNEGGDPWHRWEISMSMRQIQRQFCSCSEGVLVGREFRGEVVRLCNCTMHFGMFWIVWTIVRPTVEPRLTSRLAGSIEKLFFPSHDGQGWSGFCSVCKRPLQASSGKFIEKTIGFCWSFTALLGVMIMNHYEPLPILPISKFLPRS